MSKKKTSSKKNKKKDFGWVSPDFGRFFRHHRGLIWLIFTIVAISTIVIYGLTYIVDTYHVENIYVDGNVHYTGEEIIDMVTSGRFGHNSLYLSIKYKNKGIEDIPFVETMDVEIVDPNTIRINVYEKALAGCVEYLGRYIYFDKDGIVVETSEHKTEGVPEVTGLEFAHVILYEPLPVDNTDVFKRVLNMTQLLNKYEFFPDKIYFSSSYDATLVIGKVRVSVGNDDYFEEKLQKLTILLPSLAGKSGILEMENYTEDTKNITFKEDLD